MRHNKYLDESLFDMDKRCEKCDTLLSDNGTCPKCDEGEEDYGDDDLQESLSVRERLMQAFPGEFNFDKSPELAEDCVTEELSNKEKLLRTYPELNFDTEVVVEELSAREKLKRAFPDLDLYTKTEIPSRLKRAVPDMQDETVHEDDSEDIWEEYDDEFEMDDVEQDRVHAALYGGDRMYCSCGRKLVMDEWGGYCPDCDAEYAEESRQQSLYENESSVTKDDLMRWLQRKQRGNVDAQEFETLLNTLWSAIELEVSEGASYQSIEDVDVGELIDAADNPAHDIGYKLLGLYDDII